MRFLIKVIRKNMLVIRWIMDWKGIKKKGDKVGDNYSNLEEK